MRFSAFLRRIVNVLDKLNSCSSAYVGGKLLTFIPHAWQPIVVQLEWFVSHRLSGDGGLPAVSFSTVSPSPLTAVALQRSPAVPSPTVLGNPGVQLRCWDWGYKPVVSSPTIINPTNNHENRNYPSILYPFLLLFTAVEAVFGLLMMLGFMTRLSGLVIAILAWSIGAAGGWLGPTCVDEWQIAVVEDAAGLMFMLTGSRWLSIDQYLARKWPRGLRMLNLYIPLW